MISTALLLLFLAFYLLYNTSEKSVKQITFGFETWVKQHNKETKTIGVLMLFIAFVILNLAFGIGAGSLIFLIVLMTIGSLVIVLTPIKIITPKLVEILFVVLLCTECLIF